MSLSTVDKILIAPSETEEEYLQSFFLTTRDERDFYHAKQRHNRKEVLGTMTDKDIQEILRMKRQYEPECHSIIVLWNELSFRSKWPDPNRKDLNEWKEKISILEVIESYVTLSRYRKGSLIKCPLPDHADWSPSFMIYEKDNRYKCFGCQSWGSQIDFIMSMEGCDLKTAINKFLQY